MKFIEFLKKNSAKDNSDTRSDKIFLRSVVISFVAIAICVVMLSASSYAWFIKSIDSSETIQSSIYTLDISAEPEENLTEGLSADGNITYSLIAGVEYTVRIHAIDDGTTNGSTGYVKVIIGDRTYYSQQINRGHTLEFKITFSTDTSIEIVERWGTSSISDSDRDITNGDSFVDMQKTIFSE